MSFRHAVELLRADLPLAGPLRAVKTSTVRKLPPPVTSGDDREALLQVVDYYHATLKQSPEALGYLESRGLKSAEMIERFKLGYANRTLGLRLPAKSRAAGEELRGRLQRLGAIRESGHEHLNGSVVIPIFDEDGGVAGMYGRKITPNLRPGTPLHSGATDAAPGVRSGDRDRGAGAVLRGRVTGGATVLLWAGRRCGGDQPAQPPRRCASGARALRALALRKPLGKQQPANGEILVELGPVDADAAPDEAPGRELVR